MAKTRARKEMDPFGYAMNFLSYRPRSCKEVDQALRKHGVSPTVREEVLHRLQDLGLLNDVAFAESWIHFRTAPANPKGRQGVRQELREKGLDEDVIEEAMAQYYPSQLEEDLVEVLLAGSKEKICRQTGDQREKALHQAANRLQYRGFGSSVIYNALQDLRRTCLDSSED